jgi:hypothetical protein
LCKRVLEVFADVDHITGDRTCPFCQSQKVNEDNEGEHKPYCAILIAKDLSTNLKEKL